MKSATARLLLRQLTRTTTRVARPLAIRSLSSTTPLHSSSAAAAAVSNARTAAAADDYIRDSIHQILEHYGSQIDSVADKAKTTQNTGRKTMVVSDEDLDRALDTFKYQLEEARLCLKDCTECEKADLPEEILTADMALQQAVQCLVDLLDYVREGESEQQERFRSAREEAVSSIRDLRTELKLLKDSIA